MAASISLRGVLGQAFKFTTRQQYLQRSCCHKCVQRMSTKTDTDRKLPDAYFFQSDVQDILKKVTGFRLDKVFHRKMTDTEAPKILLATDEQYEELQEGAIEKGHQMLQMPPILTSREEAEVILSDDMDIEGHATTKMVFTDITYGISDKSRVMVVREPSGKLRMAMREERDRLFHTYFPVPGKMHNTPKMFSEEHLERLLHEERYEYILDRACVQFEPDDPQYIRITHRTYDVIASRGHFESLRSSRHFGSMTFYLTFYEKPETLMVDMLQRSLLSDAANVVRLYHLIHPECPSAQTATKRQVDDPMELIALFIQETSSHGGPVQLALQSYQDEQQSTSRQQRAR